MKLSLRVKPLIDPTISIAPDGVEVSWLYDILTMSTVIESDRRHVSYLLNSLHDSDSYRAARKVSNYSLQSEQD